MKDTVQAKEKLKTIPFMTFGLCIQFIRSVHQRQRNREKERLANAHVFCLDGDVVP